MKPLVEIRKHGGTGGNVSLSHMLSFKILVDTLAKISSGKPKVRELELQS